MHAFFERTLLKNGKKKLNLFTFALWPHPSSIICFKT